MHFVNQLMPDYSFSLKATYRVWSRARNRKFISVFVEQMLSSNSYCGSFSWDRLSHPEWKLKSYLPTFVSWTISHPRPKHVTVWKEFSLIADLPQNVAMEFLVGAGKQDLFLTARSAYSCLVKAEVVECFCASFTV